MMGSSGREDAGVGVSTAAIPIDSSNIGFKLLKKHGWTEGTGLGIAQQGRLEPVPAFIKKNKRGLGAEKSKKAVDKSSGSSSGSKIVKDGDKEKESGARKTKGISKKMKKVLEIEKRMQEREFEQAFFREFWPDNV